MLRMPGAALPHSPPTLPIRLKDVMLNSTVDNHLSLYACYWSLFLLILWECPRRNCICHSSLAIDSFVHKQTVNWSRNPPSVRNPKNVSVLVQYCCLYSTAVDTVLLFVCTHSRMNPRSDVHHIYGQAFQLVPSFHSHWVPPRIGLPVQNVSQALITVRVPSANISVLSINMKDAALYGKLIEDSMLWPVKWKDNVKPITRSSNFYRCIKLRNGLSLEQRTARGVYIDCFRP